jgi:hypothetical protein
LKKVLNVANDIQFTDSWDGTTNRQTWVDNPTLGRAAAIETVTLRHAVGALPAITKQVTVFSRLALGMSYRPCMSLHNEKKECFNLQMQVNSSTRVLPSV